MLKLNKITYSYFQLLLFSPLLSYISIAILGLPKGSTFFFVYITVFYGLVYLFYLGNKLILPGYIYFLILFAIFIFLRINIYEIDYKRDMHFLTKLYHDFRYLSMILFIAIIYNTQFSDKFIESSITIIKVTIILAFTASVIQIFDKDFLNPRQFQEAQSSIEGNLYTFRRSSIFGFVDPNEAGLSFIPLLSVFIGHIIYKKKRGLLIFLILGGLICFLTNGRYVIIGFFIVTLQLLYYYKVKFSSAIRYIFLLILLVPIFFFILKYFGYDFSDWYYQRLLNEGSLYETTRYKAIGTFMKFFPEHWLFGGGLSISNEVTKASHLIGSSQIHVGYLSNLAYYGIVGSFFLFGFWFILARHLYKNAKITNYWGSFFAFAFYLWAQFALVNNSMFFYGLIFALIFDKYYKDKHIESFLSTELSFGSSNTTFI